MLVKSAIVGLAAVLFFYYYARGKNLSSILPGSQDFINWVKNDNVFQNRSNIFKNYEVSHDDIKDNNHGRAANTYFAISTDFFEWGWGDAFHMAPLKKTWSFKESMNFWELWFANRLGINEKSKVADLGMGIGGPMRRISEFTGAEISGATICKRQIVRANQLSTDSQKNSGLLHYHLGDYNGLPLEHFPSNSFDVVYFMESLSHSNNRTLPLSEAYRILKPGGIVGAWQWMLLDSFNYNDPKHVTLKENMEYGGGLSNLNKPSERIVEFNKAGFNLPNNKSILESFEMSDAIKKQMTNKEWNPFWVSLASGHDIPSFFTSSWIGRRVTMFIAYFTELIGIAEKDTYKTALMLEYCGHSAAVAGEMEIWTPLWFIKAQKPIKKNE